MTRCFNAETRGTRREKCCSASSAVLVTVSAWLLIPAPNRSVRRRDRRSRAPIARRGDYRCARSGQDHARAAGAAGRRPGHPAAAAARRRAGDCRAHRRRARLDARPRGRLAGPVRAALQRRDAAAGGDRRHPDRAPADRSAAVRLCDDRPRRISRAQRARGSGDRAGAAGLARARRPSHRRHVGDAGVGAGVRLPRRLSGDRRRRAAAIRSTSPITPASRSPTRRSVCWARPTASCCASCRAQRRSAARSASCSTRPAAASTSSRCTDRSTPASRISRCVPHRAAGSSSPPTSPRRR